MSADNMQPTAKAGGNDTVMAAIATIPVIGLIIYFGMKDASDLVKFYAKQSIGLLLLGIVQSVISIVLGFLPLTLTLGIIATLISCVLFLFSLVIFVLWVVMVINALQGKKFRTPVMSDMLDNLIK